MDDFKFDVGDVVLAEWEDKLFYAKIQKIDSTKSYCHLIFDDNSVEECPFSKIHSVTETTAEIVCIICKDGTSAQPNEIVLCDKCGIGYHQKCHDPPIPAKALQLDEPWMCTYCTVGAFCPYLENPFEEKDKKHEPLRKRRIHSIRGENRVVANSLSSEEHRLLAKRPVNQTMSGFYYTSPSQHREGHRPRGRPPFSHKKHINDKRGRGVGRSPNRNSSRERDHQEERENEQDTSSRKHYSKHSSEMQHRSSYPRYSSPSRNNRHGEDVDSSGSDRSQSNKDSASSPSANTDKKSSESSSNKQAIVKSHRRDAPREKQRLTQDLARQKRLLSEDIARAQRLQKEQITNNHDTADKKENDSDSPQEQFDGSDDLDRKECNSGKESELTMYEKCYGSFAVMSPGDDSPAESRKDEEPTSTATNKNKTESLFERILSKGAVKEAKQIEFVNESQLEMRSDEEKYDSELAKGSLASPTSDIANSRVDLNRKVKLPDFENVTDDELNTSENEGSGLLKNFNDASSKSQVVSNRGLSDMQLQDKHSSNQSLEKVTNSCSPKDPIRDSNENNTCECLTQDGSIGDDTPNLFSKINGNENADCQSDHSNINTSKMSQILEEPNIQCEHSLKNKGECNNEENDVEGISSPCYELENSINEAENNVVNKKIAHAQYGVGKQSEDGYDKTESPNNDITEELESNKEMDTASLEQDTDVSNNEGMSDAEELSDLEPVTSTGRSKVKRKTRKKVKNTKAVVKTTSSPQRLPRRSKTGRRIGRPPKASKQLRQLDSDSDEQESLDYRTENKEDVQRSKSQSPKNELSGVDGKNDENSAAVEENCLEEHETLPENRDGGKTDETKDADDIDDDDELSTPSLQHQDSDTEDASQDIFSLTETERQQLEEQGRKERARKDKRIAARQKRKSIEREREKERATPPHLVSQNRFARDLPRHNWLVERLLQQKKLGEEALKPDSNQNSDNPEGNSDEEGNPGEDLPVGLEELKYAETDVNAQDKPKENLSDSAEMKNDPPSPQRDEFQSELHRSFLRRSFPPNVPRTPPKLKPASPDNSSSTESKPMPPTLKHKLQSKEHSALEPIPKLKKIVPEKTNETEENSTKEEKSNENERSSSPKENESTRKQVSPIEIFDDDDDKKKQEASEDSKVSKSSSSPVTSSSFSSEKLLSEKKEESHSPRLSSFSPPKKNMPYPSSKKVVHSVSPTLPGSGKEISSHPMGPHHRAAILIPVVPMHDANGLPLPPSLGPTSPHMKPYSPRTFTPHLITHNPTFSTAGFFSGLPPANRYPSASCHHHFHPGMKPGPCKRDVNCPFHGSPTRGLPPGILGLPSHHPSMAAFNPHGHDHISQILAREHREGHCPNSDCKMCRQGKESPKIRELDSQSNQEKTSPQPSKVVKPIAHVPGMRPPLMLSHLQQFGGRPTQAFSDIDSIQEEKARRSGMEPILSPRQKINSSPERSSRDSLAPGLFTTERRSLPHHFTLSDLNRRREQDLMKGPQDLLSSIKHRPMPGEFMVPGFASAPSHSKPGLIHPKDSTLFTSSRSQSVVVSQADKREFSRGEERDRSGFLSDSLKSGPPRLRSMEERDALAMRTLSEHKRREELAMRENPALLRQMTSKEGVGLPPAKLFEDRELAQSRDQGMPPLSRSAKDFDVRLMSSHGNSSILGPALRGLEDHRKMSEEERKGINREEREQGARRSADSETRERELREEQAMDALDRRRSLEQMREKEQEKRTMSEREGMRSMAMERDRIKNQFLRGVESEKHFKSQLGMPRDRSPPFLRRDMYQDRLIDPSRPDHRLDLRAAALHDLQRRQEMFRAGESSHRELLGRIASNHSVNKSLHPADKHFAERFPVEIARSLAETRSHSPSRGYPISMASRQAMDRLAAAAQGKSLPHSKDLDKDIPPHLRTEIEREREKERHRLSLEQIDVNRRLLQAELKEKVNPLVLNREIGPRDREKEMAALRERERMMLERERFVAFERLNAEERKRKRDAGELEGPFGLPGRHISSPPFVRLADFERVKRMRMSNDEQNPASSSHPPHMGSYLSNPFENKAKDDRHSSPKGPMEQRLGRPLDLDMPNKAAASMLDAMWMRERALRAREEQGRLQGKPPSTNHVSGFSSTKERPEGVAREVEARGKPDEEGVNLCSVCKRDASFLCSGCQGAWYCSAECQLSAWGKHSRDCGQSQRQ